MTTATPEKADGLRALQNACDEIEKTIAQFNGVFQIKMAVRCFPVVLCYYYLYNTSIMAFESATIGIIEMIFLAESGHLDG